MLRNALLFLSSRPALRNWAEHSRLTRRLVRRFVAGETLEDALQLCQKLNTDGFYTTLDRLGENVASIEEACRSRDAGLDALGRIGNQSLQSTVSVKLTQYGLDISEQACRENVLRLAEAAKATGSSVEVDMESSRYVDRTLAIVRAVHGAYGNVRSVIQAYLYRSRNDVEQLCREGIPVRLCKGAYLESPEVAFPKKAQVDANYRELMEIMLEKGTYPAVATHDSSMIRDALRKIARLGLKPRQYEFQMLYGVRRDLQRDLVAKGHPVRLYVPYGQAWYPYFMRRLAERPANVLFLARQLART